MINMIEPNTRPADMDEFIKDYMVFDARLCHGREFDTSESISLYACFISNEATKKEQRTPRQREMIQ